MRKPTATLNRSIRGIILAGGTGSRLYPITQSANKHLLPIYDKPMIYYALSNLIELGLTELCVVSTPDALPSYRQLLAIHSQLGLNIEYFEQDKPLGIAQAFLLTKAFIGTARVALILGDNIFFGLQVFKKTFAEFASGAVLLGYRVSDPHNYGVVEFDPQGKVISIEEKPKRPKSDYAVPGLYIYDNQVIKIAEALKPSARGELEITDVNLEYLRRGQLIVHKLNRQFAWFDAGTSSNLYKASEYVKSLQTRHRMLVGCPEMAAYRQGLLSARQLQAVISTMPNCDYKNNLSMLITEGSN